MVEVENGEKEYSYSNEIEFGKLSSKKLKNQRNIYEEMEREDKNYDFI